MLKEDNAAVLVKLNEEHGYLDLAGAAVRPRVGDRVEVIPNHCCVTVNLYDEMIAVRSGEVVESWPIIGRGKLR